jgi:hypothetical protein
VAASPPKYQAAWLGADEVFELFAQAGIDRKAAAQWLEAVWRDRGCPEIRSQHPDPAQNLFRLDPVAEKSWRTTRLVPQTEIDWDALTQRYGFLVFPTPGVPIDHTVDLPFEVSRQQLIKLLPREKAKTGRRGHDWHAVEVRVRELMDHHGDFMRGDKEWNNTARLIEKLEDEFGIGRTQLNEKVPPILDRWRQSKKSGN